MRIAVILNILDEEYQLSIFDGIKAQAKKKNIELICIQNENSDLSLNPFTSQMPFSFGIDGIILLTSVFSEEQDNKENEKIRKLWGDIPIISVGKQINNIPSVSIKARQSMEQLTRHLIKDHQYKKFLFLSGKVDYKDTNDRLGVFEETVKKFQASGYDLNYVILNGGFTELSANHVISGYIAENLNNPADVIVCANDNMALGVYKFLKTTDAINWSHCAVTGFDDIPQAKMEIPAFTTVRQPLREMGTKAIDLIDTMISGSLIPNQTYIDSSLIIRQSCGCKSEQSDEEIFNRERIIKIQKKYLQSEKLLRRMSHLGQMLNTCTSNDGLIYNLDTNLDFIDIENFMVISFEKPLDSMDDFTPSMKAFNLYERRNGIRITPYGTPLYGTVEEFISSLSKSSKYSLVYKSLFDTSKFMGFLIYDAPLLMHPYICSLSVNLAQTIRRHQADKEKQEYSERLEKEVTERTKELVKANNKRIQVEAEVLKISEMERQRFSTDLHDDICQRLAGIAMLCRVYSSSAERVTQEQMSELTELITDTLQATRQYAHNSFPVELTSLGMKDSIGNLCASVQEQYKLKIEYNWKIKNFEFDKMQALNIFRIIQESLHNITKHARATETKVWLEEKKDTIVISISDNGKGMTKQEKTKQGIGLHSMQYRADQINAKFNIKQNKPDGTIVQIVLPKK